MRLLVLGGTSFVGRTVVTEAADRGWSVTTFNRGRGSWAHPQARRITGDRTLPADLDQLRSEEWDVVVDTWAGAPWVVRDSATALVGRVRSYGFISSRAVYATPTLRDMDETAATVRGSADAVATSYREDKRGAEVAVEAAFGDRCLLARAGLILGPYEEPGRLPIWLRRIAGGGQVVAPGPADLPWRFIDVRDLADWLLGGLALGLTGPFNLVAPEGHASTRTVLEAAKEVTGRNDAELVWIDPITIKEQGIDRWEAFPGWVPPEPDLYGLVWTDVSKSMAAGLSCRPARDTVNDTWEWMMASGGLQPPER